jgi:hypothetical protein
MPSHKLLRDLVALKEGLSEPSPTEEASFRLVVLANRVAEYSLENEVVLSLDQAELLG